MIEVITISTINLTICAESERLKKCYPIAIGKREYPTPRGEFRAISKRECPTFVSFKTGRAIKGCTSNNPLGRYYIEFKNVKGLSWGIHGTNEPRSIGKRVSHGCVRMHNKDIAEMFPYVDMNTKIIIK